MMAGYFHRGFKQLLPFFQFIFNPFFLIEMLTVIGHAPIEIVLVKNRQFSCFKFVILMYPGQANEPPIVVVVVSFLLMVSSSRHPCGQIWCSTILLLLPHPRPGNVLCTGRLFWLWSLGIGAAPLVSARECSPAAPTQLVLMSLGSTFRI